MFKKNYRPSLHLIILASLFIPHFVLAQQSAQNNSQQFTETISQSRFVITVDGGLGYLIASTKSAKAQMKSYGISDQEANRYYRELKLGEQAGASAYYLINKTYGLGLDYNLFGTNGSVMGYLDPGDGWTKFYGPFNEKIYTSFVGASVFQSQKLNERWSQYGKFSLGMALYRNEARIIVAPALITGSAFAIRGEYGVAYSLTRNLSVNAGISYLLSSLRKIQMDDGTNSTEVKLEGDSKENLSRLNLSTGLQFNF